MKHNWPGTLLAVAALAGVGWCRFHPEAADWYALHFYPKWSAGVSSIAAWIPWSLDEIVVAVAILVLIVRLIRFRKRWLAAVNLLLWITVWFYVGWGINYFRSDIYSRAGKEPAMYDKARFQTFLNDFTVRINQEYIPNRFEDKERLAWTVRSWYASRPPEMGLALPHDWQEPKKLLFNRLYSAVGVMGYVGPFFNEIQVNMDTPSIDYPLSYAHEYAHLLGVSSEAEANYWGYKACLSSSDATVRESARQSLLPYIMQDARRILDQDEYERWYASLRPEVIEVYNRNRNYWAARYNPVVGKIQDWFYNLYLKSNRISAGTANYGEVIQMIITLDY